MLSSPQLRHGPSGRVRLLPGLSRSSLPNSWVGAQQRVKVLGGPVLEHAIAAGQSVAGTVPRRLLGPLRHCGGRRHLSAAVPRTPHPAASRTCSYSKAPERVHPVPSATHQTSGD